MLRGANSIIQIDRFFRLYHGSNCAKPNPIHAAFSHDDVYWPLSGQHQVTHENARLSNAIPTLAEELSDRGYTLEYSATHGLTGIWLRPWFRSVFPGPG